MSQRTNMLIDLAAEWFDASTKGHMVFLKPITLGAFESAVIHIEQAAQAAQRCQCCGYLVTQSEHRGCLKSAAQAEEIERLKRRNQELETLIAAHRIRPRGKSVAHHVARIAKLEQALRDAPEDAEIGRFLLRHATEWTRKPYISDYENEAPYAVMGLRVPYDTDLSSIGMRRYAVQQAMKALEQTK